MSNLNLRMHGTIQRDGPGITSRPQYHSLPTPSLYFLLCFRCIYNFWFAWKLSVLLVTHLFHFEQTKLHCTVVSLSTVRSLALCSIWCYGYRLQRLHRWWCFSMLSIDLWYIPVPFAFFHLTILQSSFTNSIANRFIEQPDINQSINMGYLFRCLCEIWIYNVFTVSRIWQTCNPVQKTAVMQELPFLNPFWLPALCTNAIVVSVCHFSH